MIFKTLFSRKTPKHTERRVYESIVAQARQPVFYEELGVADTVTGRFDLIILHAFLVFDRLKKGTEEERVLSQDLVDEMFRDMDRSLREMGVGDLSISKRMRTMADVFMGRCVAYEQAFEEEDEPSRHAALKSALVRNIFPDGADEAVAVQLTDYVAAVREHLEAQTLAAIISGDLVFPDPAETIVEGTQNR